MIRKAVCIIAACVLAAGLCACGSTGAAQSDVTGAASAAENVDVSGAEAEQEDQTDAEAEQGQSADADYSIDYLILVDSDHPLPENWEDEVQLEETTNSVGDVVKVEKNAYKAYLEMEKELSEEGITVELDSAYRSVAEQQKIIDDFTEKYGADYARTYAAVPGTSEHHTGLALDLYLIVDGVTVYENEDLMQYPEVWEKIHEKLPEYGFILRYPGNNGYPYEPWHIRYVGKKAAEEIAERGISFEEYWRENQ